MPRFSENALQKLAHDVFVACHAPPEEAALVAQHLVQSSLMGIDSHGVMRIPQYVDSIHQGVIRPGSRVSVCNDHGAIAVLDCNHNFGQVGATRTVELAIQKAQQFGVACVLCKNASHTGRVGAYTQTAAEAGMIALATCNGPHHGHFVAPFGGREGRLPTNPISFAAPTEGDPILVDFSTSMASEGKIRVYRDQGQPLPPGWIVDYRGRPSTNPADFYGPPRGAILPMGGAVGYKGFFLGLMVEILCSTLAGDSVTCDALAHHSLCLLVINAESFLPRERHRALMTELMEYVVSSAPLPGSEGVTNPGQREFQTAKLRRLQGIEIPHATYREIVRVASGLKVKLPLNVDAGLPARTI